LRGYFTKYDCSAADVNPIGSFSKIRLREYLGWNSQTHKFSVINEVLNATPSAELQPLEEGDTVQTDEEDMGFSYSELHLFGKLRSLERLGPVSMFDRISNSGSQWRPDLLAAKIKKFFRYYSMHRHKMNTLTPTFHYNPEGCDDNRFDMRPILYEADWGYQFEILEERVREAAEKRAQQ
jgi:NAD+ synthase (glutamine-hydrolysing)